jgi:hypothetical protein
MLAAGGATHLNKDGNRKETSSADRVPYGEQFTGLRVLQLTARLSTEGAGRFRE